MESEGGWEAYHIGIARVSLLYLSCLGYQGQLVQYSRAITISKIESVLQGLWILAVWNEIEVYKPKNDWEVFRG